MPFHKKYNQKIVYIFLVTDPKGPKGRDKQSKKRPKGRDKQSKKKAKREG
jgi:hypothetical protein